MGSWSLDAEGDMPAMDPITCLERPRTLSSNTMGCAIPMSASFVLMMADFKAVWVLGHTSLYVSGIAEYSAPDTGVASVLDDR